MFNPTQFVAPSRLSIVVTDGVKVGDPTDPARRFTERFGVSWRLIPGQKCVYHLRDRQDRVHFTMMKISEGWDIAAYPDVSWEEFKAAWVSGDRAILVANAIYRQTTAGEYQFLMDLLQILKELDIPL